MNVFYIYIYIYIYIYKYQKTTQKLTKTFERFLRILVLHIYKDFGLCRDDGLEILRF